MKKIIFLCLASFKIFAIEQTQVTQTPTIVTGSKILFSVSSGTFTNFSTLLVEQGGSIGIEAKNTGIGSNQGQLIVKAKKFTSAMKTSGKTSQIINEKLGIIMHYGDNINTSNAMLSQGGGKADNQGKIIISGKNTSAMNANGSSTLLNSGIIINSNLANALKLEGNSIGENTGSIFSSGSSAILLNKGFFINTGLISTQKGVAVNTTSGSNNAIFLKSGSITGKILGNSGIDLVYLGSNVSHLQIHHYESIITTKNNLTLSNSTVVLKYNPNIAAFRTEANKQFQLTNSPNPTQSSIFLQNSIIALDLGNSQSQKFDFLNAKTIEIDEHSIISLKSKENATHFNLTKILQNPNLNIKSKSIIWDYYQHTNRDWLATKKPYTQALKDKKLLHFAQLLQSLKTNNTDLEFSLLNAESLTSKASFTQAMAELSGSLHGYVIDIASMNSNLFAESMIQQAKQTDFTKIFTQGKTTHKLYTFIRNSTLNGNLQTDYGEIGAYGMIENITSAHSKVGFTFGGGKGKAIFNQEKSGKAILQNFYVGAYYRYDLPYSFSIISNARVTGSYATTTRNISYANLNQTFNAEYPIYGFGIGFLGQYNYIKDYFKLGLFAGMDYTRLTQGNLYEDQSPSSSVNGIAINSTGSVDEESYDSFILKIGASLENIGYLFSRKYALGLNLQYQSQLGNIKNKRLKLQALTKQHTFQTIDLTHLLGYGLYARYYFTPYFSLNTDLNGLYTKEYNSILFSLGLSYKFDSLEAMLNSYKIPEKTRWRGSISFILETEDNSDRIYFNALGEKTSGDYITSTRYIPKLLLNFTDTHTNLSYYYEGFYSDNQMFQGLHHNEAKQFATRAYLRVGWKQTVDFFTQTYSLAYRNETSKKPFNFGKANFEFLNFGTHQIHFSPSYSFNLGKGFSLWGNVIGMWSYNFLGSNKGESDFFLESYVGLNYTYSKLFLNLTWFRGDKWYNPKNQTDRYIINQMRPLVRFNFGNGANIELSARFPLPHGEYYRQARTQIIQGESYETRYTIKYTQPLFLGLIGSISASLLDIEYKSLLNHSKYHFHSFRTSLGLTYNFGF